jgi:hypothetical protein
VPCAVGSVAALSTVGEGLCLAAARIVGKLIATLRGRSLWMTIGRRQSMRGRENANDHERGGARTSGGRLPEIVVVTATRITQLVACIP